MIMKTIFEMVMRSDLLAGAVARFEYVNNLKENSTEAECYMLGYVRAVEDVYTFIENNSYLIPKIYEKQDVTTK
jgi:hypothetical protein